MSHLTNLLTAAGAAGALCATPLQGAKLSPSWIDSFFEPFDWPDRALVRSEMNGMSMYEKEGKLYIESALPGLNEDEVTLTLDKGVLSITGHKERNEDQEDVRYYYRSSSQFNYRIRLPETVDTTNPEATFKNGQMTIVFNKRESEESRRIPFNT